MTQREQDRARAIALITQLTAQGHTVRYIAEALDRARIPTLSGRPGAKWNRGRVWELQRTGAQSHDRAA
jgi:hypothetical protein